MPEYTPKQRRRGLEFANELAAIAARAPDVVSKEAVFSAVRRIREFHGFSEQEKRDLIVRAVQLGCSTYDDLVRETKLAKPHVAQIIRDMSEAGTVELRQLESGERGGRPMVYIRLIASANG